MRIIGANERLAEKRGAKILITGPVGVGTRVVATGDGLFADAPGQMWRYYHDVPF
jgi:hypothetical protein